MMDTFNSLINNRNKKPLLERHKYKAVGPGLRQKESPAKLLLNVKVKLGDFVSGLIKAECEDRGVDSKWLILRIGAGSNRN